MLFQKSEDQKYDKQDLMYDEKLMNYIPITVTTLMAILFVINLFIPIGNVGIALISIALLPWFLPFIAQITLPGGASI